MLKVLHLWGSGIIDRYVALGPPFEDPKKNIEL